MRELIKEYKQSVPALRFIGKKYSENDSVNGFGAKWNEWFDNGWFSVLENLVDGQVKDIYEDGDAYVGLIGGKGTIESPMEYWIGMFMPESTTVPEEFTYIDFPKSLFGICWIYGKENELYGNYGQCVEKLTAEGFEFNSDLPWCFERYVCPRFTTPDEQGKVILDVGFFVK